MINLLSRFVGFVMRQQSCDFEPGGSSVCGWSVLTPFHGATGVAAADQPPPLGPHDDVEPGGSQGQRACGIIPGILDR